MMGFTSPIHHTDIHHNENLSDFTREFESDDEVDSDYFLDLDYEDDGDGDDDCGNCGTISDSPVPPPLPLCNFEPDEALDTRAKTIAGLGIRCVPHIHISNSTGCRLHDPIKCRYFIDWFISRDHRERALRDHSNETSANHLSEDDAAVLDKADIYDYSVYRCTPFTKREDWVPRDEDREAERGGNAEEGGVRVTKESEGGESLTSSLVFDSEFECGNLESASRVVGRETLHQPGEGSMPPPSVLPVDQEYDLHLRNDLHTNGNIQWYYFSVSTTTLSPSSTPTPQEAEDNLSSHTPSPPSPKPIQYPMTVRFNIVNMMKSDALYNYGMKPAVYSVKKANRGVGWRHAGENVCYYKNSTTFVKKRRDKLRRQHHYTLTFTYTFTEPDTVYFAHCFPYTYTRLQQFLMSLEKDTRIRSFIRRKLLCHSLANNRCDMVTITAPSTNPLDMSRRPAIIITGRVHPGESNSSFVMEGLLSFLTSEEPEAVKLRETYVIKVVPMLNPDGVIHGNYRCSLAGVDLNRKYLHPDPLLHPTITAVKSLIASTNDSRGIVLYLDIHGHSMRKNVFLYGCDPNQTNIDKVSAGMISLTKSQLLNRSIFARIFPKVLVSVSTDRSNNKERGYFSFEDCALSIQKSKSGTGRVVSWRNIGISAAYTVEISFCGNGNNTEIKLIKAMMSHHRKTKTKADETVRTYERYLTEEEGPWAAPLNQALKAYKTNVHYTEDALISMGFDIGHAVHAYSNLDRAFSAHTKDLMCRPSERSRPASAECRSGIRMSGRGEDGKSVDDRRMRSRLLEQELRLYTPNTVGELTNPLDILQPILLPAVISSDVLSTIVNQTGSVRDKSVRNVRIDAEISLRNLIRLSLHGNNESKIGSSGDGKPNEDATEEIKDTKRRSRSKSNSKLSSGNPTPEVVVEYNLQEEDEIIAALHREAAFDDMGSDSDPSGDDAPVTRLAQSASFMHLAQLSQYKLGAKLKSMVKQKVRHSRKARKSNKERRSSSNPSRVENSIPKPTISSSSRKVSVLAPHRQAIADAVIWNSSQPSSSSQLGSRRNSLSSGRGSMRLRNPGLDTSTQFKRPPAPQGQGIQDMQSRRDNVGKLQLTSAITTKVFSMPQGDSVRHYDGVSQTGLHVSMSTGSLNTLSRSQEASKPRPLKIDQNKSDHGRGSDIIAAPAEAVSLRHHSPCTVKDISSTAGNDSKLPNSPVIIDKSLGLRTHILGKEYRNANKVRPPSPVLDTRKQKTYVNSCS